MDNHKLNIIHFQTHKHMNNKHNKKRLTNEQVSLLESSFVSYKKLEPEQKLRLARQLGLPPRRIAVWYQNRRARWKSQSLEFDYNGLQQSLDIALAEKRRLEEDVDRLKGELEKAQEMLVDVNQIGPPCASSSISTTTSFENDNEVWQIDDLYHLYVTKDGSNWI